MSTRPASNFDFLAHHDPRLVVLGAEAERQFAEFPVACIGTLRRFAEILAQRAAAKVGVLVDPKEAQVDVLGRLAQRALWEALAQEAELRRAEDVAAADAATEAVKAKHAAELGALQAQAVAASPQAIQATVD